MISRLLPWKGAAAHTLGATGLDQCLMNVSCGNLCLQFIVVSLKDGMFNNANVLFKTKFVDGVSTVTRYVQNQSSVHNGSIGFRDGPRDKKAAKKPNKRIRSDNVEDSD